MPNTEQPFLFRSSSFTQTDERLGALLGNVKEILRSNSNVKQYIPARKPSITRDMYYTHFHVKAGVVTLTNNVCYKVTLKFERDYKYDGDDERLLVSYAFDYVGVDEPKAMTKVVAAIRDRNITVFNRQTQAGKYDSCPTYSTKNPHPAQINADRPDTWMRTDADMVAMLDWLNINTDDIPDDRIAVSREIWADRMNKLEPEIVANLMNGYDFFDAVAADPERFVNMSTRDMPCALFQKVCECSQLAKELIAEREQNAM